MFFFRVLDQQEGRAEFAMQCLGAVTRDGQAAALRGAVFREGRIATQRCVAYGTLRQADTQPNATAIVHVDR